MSPGERVERGGREWKGGGESGKEGERVERGGREWKGGEEGGRLVSQIGIFKNLFFYKARYF